MNKREALMTIAAAFASTISLGSISPCDCSLDSVPAVIDRQLDPSLIAKHIDVGVIVEDEFVMTWAAL